MFDALREVNIVPAWDVKMPELEKLFEQHITRPIPKTGTPPRTSEERPTDKNGTTTHTQTPITNNQIDINNITPSISTPQGSGVVDSEISKTIPAGEICKALKAAGLQSVSPNHPELLALIAKGVTREQFIEAAQTAKGKRSPFAYMLTVIKGQLADAQAIEAGGGMPAKPAYESPYSAAQRKKFEVAAPMVAAQNPNATSMDPNAFLNNSGAENACTRIG